MGSWEPRWTLSSESFEMPSKQKLALGSSDLDVALHSATWLRLTYACRVSLVIKQLAAQGIGTSDASNGTADVQGLRPSFS